MHLLRIILCMLPSFAGAGIAAAQYKFNKPVLITRENGLPWSDVKCVRKGEDGFVWIGTAEGLCRFDGQFVKLFSAGKDPGRSLFDNAINTILPLRHQVWVGTSQGLSVMDTRNNSFRHYQFQNFRKAPRLQRRFDQNVSVLYRDPSGLIWVGTSTMGLCAYDAQKDDFRFYSFSRAAFPALKPSLASDNSILSITASRTNDSVIWAGTPAGLQKVNKYTGDVRLYTFERADKDSQIALNAFRRLWHHDDGLLYVGSWAAGVNVFDPVKESLTPLELRTTAGIKVLNSSISNIARKSANELWISSGAGLAIYNTHLKQVTWYRLNNSDKNEFFGLDFIDDKNRVWHQMNNGVQYFDPAVQQFARYSFKHLSHVVWAFAFYILPDSTGNTLTVCPRQTDGIYQFDRTTREWSKIPFPRNERFEKEIEAIRGFVRLSTGTYLISADKGLFVFSQQGNTMKRLDQRLPFTLQRKGELVCGEAGEVWMPDGDYGLVKWNTKTNGYEQFKMAASSMDSDNLSGRFTSLYRDSRNNIWFQTGFGIGVFLAKQRRMLHFSYAANEANSLPNVNSFAEDRHGRVWANGNDGWLGYADIDHPEKGLVAKMKINDRGIEGTVLQLAADKQGKVWGYTTRELFRIDPVDLSFTAYSFHYGVNEIDFYHFSFLPDGEIVLGGRNDIVIANPFELKRNTEVPVAYIDELQVLNRPFDFSRDGAPVQLGYRQNFFSFGFSALAFTMAKQVRFRYRLKGFDGWSEVRGPGFANYTNVPGGDYVFELQAANNEGIWNAKVLALPVHVNTAFWQTGWFRVATVLLFAFAVYLLYRYRVSAVKKKQQVKWEYEKKLANVEMTALLAQMNPHFIFNSLNSIDSYIIRNESKQASEYLNNFARLMRLILQNSRSNYISLKDELNALELYLQMESLRFKNKFLYEICVEESLDLSSIMIPPMLIQPYIENAIWHGLMTKANGEAGKVVVDIRRDHNNLLCVIRDNGIGRKRAAELKEKRQSNHKRSMGMQITRDRIEIINKLYKLDASVRICDLENAVGEALGTRVELTIPV